MKGCLKIGNFVNEPITIHVNSNFRKVKGVRRKMPSKYGDYVKQLSDVANSGALNSEVLNSRDKLRGA